MAERWGLIFDFSESEDAAGWHAINDGVMGGVSAGRMQFSPERTALFTGRVSLVNSGGFASVRSAPAEYDLAAFVGIGVRVRGDGKRYKLRLRTDPDFDGVTYEVAFIAPAGEWTVIRVPFDVFMPVFRGRVLSNAPRLNPAAVKTFGLLISDKQAGPFRLELAWLSAFGEGDAEPGMENAGS